MLKNMSKTLKLCATKIFAGAPLYSIAKLIESEDGVPVLNIKDVVNDRIVTDNLKYFSLNNFKNADRYIVFPGDIIITCRGTQLKIAIVPDNLQKAIITSNLIAIRLTNELLPIFLTAYFKTQEGQKTLQANIESSTMQFVLNVSNIGEFSIPVPPLSAQEKIVNLMYIAEKQYHLSIESANLRKTITNQIITEMICMEEKRGEINQF